MDMHDEEKRGLLGAGNDKRDMSKSKNNMAGRSMVSQEFDEDHHFMQIADELQEMGQENILAALGGTTGE